MANNKARSKPTKKKNWSVCVNRLFKYQTREFDAFDELEPRVREIVDVYIKTMYKDSPEYPISVGNKYNVDEVKATNDGGMLVTLTNESRPGVARFVIPAKLVNAPAATIRQHLIKLNPMLGMEAR